MNPFSPMDYRHLIDKLTDEDLADLRLTREEFDGSLADLLFGVSPDGVALDVGVLVAP